MDDDVPLSLIAVLLLVAANGFFVATEFALVAVRRTRIEQLAAQGNTNARSVLDALNHLDAYIAATQLGITMASLALGWIGEPALAHLIDPLLLAIPLPAEARSVAAHAVSVILAFAVIPPLLSVLGDWGRRASRSSARKQRPSRSPVRSTGSTPSFGSPSRPSMAWGMPLCGCSGLNQQPATPSCSLRRS